jgi:hypothetical protein
MPKTTLSHSKMGAADEKDNSDDIEPSPFLRTKPNAIPSSRSQPSRRASARTKALISKMAKEEDCASDIVEEEDPPSISRKKTCDSTGSISSRSGEDWTENERGVVTVPLRHSGDMLNGVRQSLRNNYETDDKSDELLNTRKRRVRQKHSIEAFKNNYVKQSLRKVYDIGDLRNSDDPLNPESERECARVELKRRYDESSASSEDAAHKLQQKETNENNSSPTTARVQSRAPMRQRGNPPVNQNKQRMHRQEKAPLIGRLNRNGFRPHDDNSSTICTDHLEIEDEIIMLCASYKQKILSNRKHKSELFAQVRNKCKMCFLPNVLPFFLHEKEKTDAFRESMTRKAKRIKREMKAKVERSQYII